MIISKLASAVTFQIMTNYITWQLYKTDFLRKLLELARDNLHKSECDSRSESTVLKLDFDQPAHGTTWMQVLK
jgi:hypothetical protein